MLWKHCILLAIRLYLVSYIHLLISRTFWTVLSFSAGNFPSSLLSLPYFQTLDLEYTAITGRIDTAPFSSATELTTLMLVSNSQLGTSMPDLSSNTKLVTAAVTGQGLADAKADKLPSSLTYLWVKFISLKGDILIVHPSDLSYNSLSGQIPPLSQLTSLKTLYLQSNDFTSAPDSLPSSLTTMSFTSNSRLSGAMPSSVCSSTVLTSCDLRSTNLTAGMTSSSSRSSLSSHMSSVTASSTITSMASTSGTSVKASGSAMSSVSSSSGSSSAASDTSVKSSTMIGVSARASTEGTCGVCQFN